ncbi:MAG TPA: hypothetical protein H9687_00480 [Firmicutes bacterium]|nr:hypothetical protein [Bacillota bacterium]
MRSKAAGACFISAGVGMVVMIFLPWWGFLAAIILTLAGFLLLHCSSK